MSKNVISSEEVSLLIKRLINDRIKLVSWLVTKDGIKVSIKGYLRSATPEDGLIVATSFEDTTCYLTTGPVTGATFTYNDEAQMPDAPHGSGLSVLLKSGARLTLIETKNQ